jgi:hypothetical protein
MQNCSSENFAVSKTRYRTCSAWCGGRMLASVLLTAFARRVQRPYSLAKTIRRLSSKSDAACSNLIWQELASGNCRGTRTSPDAVARLSQKLPESGAVMWITDFCMCDIEAKNLAEQAAKKRAACALRFGDSRNNLVELRRTARSRIV